jgi:hypothetical protein
MYVPTPPLGKLPCNSDPDIVIVLLVISCEGGIITELLTHVTQKDNKNS